MPLSAPVNAVAVERAAGPFGRAAVACMQGIRNNFEDAHLLDPSGGYFGVFDGHLGDEAAAFCAERLHLHTGPASSVTASSLVLAFEACDGELRKALAEMDDGSEAGSTATLVAARPAKTEGKFSILVGNCGDSRAILVKSYSGTGEIQSTHDHRPSDARERERIEAAGGFVSEEFDPPRVDGQLACSRALGAFKFKQDSSRNASEQKVSCTPEVFEWEAAAGDLLVVACDGVWDVFSSERVVEELTKHDYKSDPGAAAAKVLQLCLEKEADDNLTLMLLCLGPPPPSAMEEAKVEVTAGNFLKTKDKEVLSEYESFCRRFGYQLTKEMKPKAPPVASLAPTNPVPGPRFSKLPVPTPASTPASASVPQAGMDVKTNSDAAILRIKVTAQKSARFYQASVQKLLGDADPVPATLEILGLGAAILNTAAVATALTQANFAIEKVETTMVSLVPRGAAERTVEVPRLLVQLRRTS